MTRKRFEITLLQFLRAQAGLPEPALILASALLIGLTLFTAWQSGNWRAWPDDIPGVVVSLAKEFLYSSLYDALKPLLAATAVRGFGLAAKAWKSYIPASLPAGFAEDGFAAPADGPGQSGEGVSERVRGMAELQQVTISSNAPGAFSLTFRSLLPAGEASARATAFKTNRQQDYESWTHSVLPTQAVV